MNSEFSFYTACLIKVKESSLPYYLPITMKADEEQMDSCLYKGY